MKAFTLLNSILLCMLWTLCAFAPASAGSNDLQKGGLVLNSSAVKDGGTLPVEYTGDGASATLPLEWSGAPKGTKSYALIMHHLDPEGITKWYWILYDIPATAHSLPKNVTGIGTLGTNSINKRTEYAPPHSKGPGQKLYVYTLYALSAPPQITVSPAQVSYDVMTAAIKDLILASADLRVVYTRPASAFALDFKAQVEKLAGDFTFTEGPLWVAAKNELLFSDIPADRIIRFTDGKFVTFRMPSHNANGLTLDKQGRLLACEHGSRSVTRLEADGTIMTLAERFEGKRLNSPNDIIVKSDGAIYFTDPPFGVKNEERELEFQGVYRIAPDGKTMTVVARDFLQPNGLAFSPDEKVLYIDDTAQGHIRAFDVAADGMLTNGRVFAQAPAPDGMKVDCVGNVYCACKTGIMVFDHTGKLLGAFATAEQPTNCAFGDTDWRTLYITCRPSLYRVRLTVPGIKVPADRSHP